MAYIGNVKKKTFLFLSLSSEWRTFLERNVIRTANYFLSKTKNIVLSIRERRTPHTFELFHIYSHLLFDISLNIRSLVLHSTFQMFKWCFCLLQLLFSWKPGANLLLHVQIITEISEKMRNSIALFRVLSPLHTDHWCISNLGLSADKFCHVILRKSSYERFM